MNVRLLSTPPCVTTMCDDPRANVTIVTKPLVLTRAMDGSAEAYNVPVEASLTSRSPAGPNEPVATIWRVSPKGMLLGSFGLFLTLFLLFIRYLPVIAMAEVKAVMPQANPHAHGDDDHAGAEATP